MRGCTLECCTLIGCMKILFINEAISSINVSALKKSSDQMSDVACKRHNYFKASHHDKGQGSLSKHRNLIFKDKYC